MNCSKWKENGNMFVNNTDSFCVNNFNLNKCNTQKISNNIYFRGNLFKQQTQDIFQKSSNTSGLDIYKDYDPNVVILGNTDEANENSVILILPLDLENYKNNIIWL